jgi:hypothetical protein
MGRRLAGAAGLLLERERKRRERARDDWPKAWKKLAKRARKARPKTS